MPAKSCSHTTVAAYIVYEIYGREDVGPYARIESEIHRIVGLFLKKEIGKVTNGALWESRVGPLADAGKLAYETGMARAD